ncbi:MAG: hypothetical protein M1825_001107 [Sarcosagium campestre]|nr:MAG: hypothetical protein M1825_001107 [Sarcosagium campestre]
MSLPPPSRAAFGLHLLTGIESPQRPYNIWPLHLFPSGPLPARPVPPTGPPGYPPARGDGTPNGPLGLNLDRGRVADHINPSLFQEKLRLVAAERAGGASDQSSSDQQGYNSDTESDAGSK